MFNPFDLAKIKQRATLMQQELSQEKVVSEIGDVKVTMTGDQKVLEVIINGYQAPNVVNALNDAITKTQKLAAEKLIRMSNQ